MIVKYSRTPIRVTAATTTETIKENRNTRFPQQWERQQYLLALVSMTTLYLQFYADKIGF